MFKINLELLRAKRRTAVVEEINSADVVEHIRGGIYIYKLAGKPYFTKSMLLDYVNQAIGWPCKNDTSSVRKFYNLVDEVLLDYIPNPQVRGGFSFQLAYSNDIRFLAKVLKSQTVD